MVMMLRVEGIQEILTPPESGYFSLEELQTMVGGYIEIARTTDGRFLVIDEQGKLKKKPLNIEATKLYLHGRVDPIVGTAILFDTKAEIEPEEEDDATEDSHERNEDQG
jgi:hypothetical protein